MTQALDWNALAQIPALRIVDCLMEGALIALFARLVLMLVRRQSAGTRFAVWFSALMAIAALPVLLPIALAMLRGGSGSDGGNIVAASIARRPAIVVPSVWALYLVAAWATIAACGLLRVGAGLVQLRALRKSYVGVDGDWLDSRSRETLARGRGSRPVALCLSDRVHVPTAIGFFKPVIVIPRWLMTELSPSELNQVLLHELAHLRRRDDWTNFAQQIVKALLFFHPAVWWIEKKISLEREMACDDAVLAETASPRAYAECLARLAEKGFLRRGVALAQAAVGHIRQTSLRVAEILNVHRPRGTRSAWKPTVALVGGFAVACAVCVSRAPRLVAFEDRASVHATSAAPVIASGSPLDETRRGDVSPSIAVRHLAAWKTAVSARPARLLKTKPANAAPNSKPVEGFASASALEQSSSGPSAEYLVHPARLHPAPAGSTQALFVLVQGYEYGSSGQTVYQISVWRVTVEPAADAPISTMIPRKT